MKRYYLHVFILGLVAGLLTAPACRTRPGYAAFNDPTKIKVGIVFDIGGKDDRSFNAAAWNGVHCAATGQLPDGTSCGRPALPNIVVRDTEPGNPVSIEPALRAFAEQGFDVVIGVGFAQTPLIEKVAHDYPGINFAIVDGVSELPNVASLVFKEHEGSYLVGMIAARANKSGTIGFLGGMDIPLIHRFAEGYKQGAKSVNPNIQVKESYVGNNDAAWNNPGKGQEISLAQIAQGADVIFAAAGNSGIGAFDAAEKKGKDSTGRAHVFAIGVDSNQNGVKPGFILTSMVKKVDTAVYQIIKEVAGKKGTGGKIGGFHVYGLPEDGVGYALDEFNTSLIPPAVLDEVNVAKQKIINGEIKVVDAMTK
jgi:basic membrane protein A